MMSRWLTGGPEYAKYQLPSYSPHYSPIEYLWKSIKRRSTHNKYFAEFDLLINGVEEALVYYSLHPHFSLPFSALL